MTNAATELLQADGVIAKRLGDAYEPRPQQLQLCTAVATALRSQRHLLAEAGTGVGKSFAYLLPAILHSVQHRGEGPVVVSTRTIALQQQLDRKDIPFLQAVLPQEWSAVTAIGRNHYLCLRRMNLARREQALLFTDPERTAELQQIVEWSISTMEGTRLGLETPVADAVWEEVKAEHGNCLHRACEHYEQCHYQRARRRTASADILVVNHALYMADVALRAAGTSYLPQHNVVIFDEAHHLERVATEGLGLRVSRGTLAWHLNRLHPRRSSRRSLLENYGTPRAMELHHRLEDLNDEFFADLQERLDRTGGRGRSLALQDAVLEDSLTEPLRELAHEIEKGSSQVQDTSLKTELVARARGLDSLQAVIYSLCNPSDSNLVRWLEAGKRSVELKSAPLRVDRILAEHVFGEGRTAVLTSATLGVGASEGETDFLHLRQQLGIPRERSGGLCLGSPFRYDRQVELVVEEAMPDPSREAEQFEREAESRILEHIFDNGGRALVLCTSWRQLNNLAAYLRPRLADADLQLLVQGEAPLVRLLKQKIDEPTSVLIGTDTLWEGIDVPGEALTLLIVTRFPFSQPDHPLTKARVRAIEERGGSGFFDHSLPEAIVKFRQGFGRLVRSANDHGKVVVLDPRARTKRYGRQFLAALPDGVAQQDW